MAGHRAASRYAKSLIELSQEKGQLDTVYADMELVSNTIDASHELKRLLKSPIIKGDKKFTVLDKIFASQTGEITSNLISLLTKKKREELLQFIAIDFIAKYKEMKGLVVANVTTAVALNDDTKANVLALIKKHVAGEIELVETINPDLIGGFVVRIGDKMIDASILKKINDLKKELLGSSSYKLN
ncbi:MAG: F-type H+-transporting ATPase subunit delta [Parvicellaceae bacterium]|jgi:F-type H+-transporting ATPase subunit delta